MQKLVAILGTTASGKSDLGVQLASRFGGEIVSADSRQVYRGLDIGTGKISSVEMNGVPHHLIDVADVSELFSLAKFQTSAYAAIDGILAAGKIPFLVGGTGLYISAVVEGYLLVDAPRREPLRSHLEQLSVAELAETLLKIDPEAGSRVDLNNPHRLERAIEVASAGHDREAMRQKSPRYNVLQLGLTWDRPVLDKRIEARLAHRLKHGMIEEVSELRRAGVSDARLDQLGLEYRFVARYLRGEIASKEQLYDELVIAIRQFSRRQLTWFRRNKSVIWLDSSGAYFDQACDLIQKWLRTEPVSQIGNRKS